MALPNFWDDTKKSEKVISELNELKGIINKVLELKNKITTNLELLNELKSNDDKELLDLIEKEQNEINNILEDLNIEIFT